MIVKEISTVCRVLMLLFHNGFEIVKMFFELVLKQICCRSNTFSAKNEKEEMGISD